MDLYFECNSGISGDMAVGALLDLGASREKLNRALNSLGLNDEFTYKISDKKVNSVHATDFDVILTNNHDDTHRHNENSEHHEHHHRNLEDIISIIDRADGSENAKNLAKKIFQIVAEAESKVHGLPVEKIHFHEVGAIDSIVDILSFSVLFDDLNPENVYFKTISEGRGSVECCHGIMNVPVPAVCEIASKYKLPIKLTENNGEMITPTGMAISASIYTAKKIPDSFIIDKVGTGSGKRPYKNPVLRVFSIINND